METTDTESFYTPLEQQVVDALKTVYDPEIPVDIYELGLIYDLVAYPDDSVYIRMTLTTPNCPSAAELPQMVREAAESVDEVTGVRLELTFEPPYTMDMMSEAARLELGFM
ncbi:MAG: iron-sulfur cluster assembly protein [Bacteroidota bacterium]